MSIVKIDSWQDFCQDIVREIRGERSQESVNSALGLNFNQMHRWESGRKRILWSEFVEFCRICDISLVNALQETVQYSRQVDQGHILFSHLVPSLELEAFTSRYQVGAQVARRWRGGESNLTLEGALQAIEFRMHSVLPFLGKILDISRVPILAKISAAEQARRELLYMHPALGMLLTTLHVDKVRRAPRHDLKLFLEYMPINPDYLQQLLDLGVSTGLLLEVDGRYDTPNLALNMRANPRRALDFYRYWTQRAEEVQRDIASETSDTFFPTFIVTTNAESRRKISEAIAHLRTTIANAVRSDDPIDRMSVIQVSCFTPTALPAAKQCSSRS